MGEKESLAMTSSDQEGLIGYNTTPNTMQAESQSGMCVLSYAALQRLSTRSLQTKPDKASYLRSGTHSRQRQADREALLTKSIPNFVPSSESHLVMGECFLNNEVPQHLLRAKDLFMWHHLYLLMSERINTLFYAWGSLV